MFSFNYGPLRKDIPPPFTHLLTIERPASSIMTWSPSVASKVFSALCHSLLLTVYALRGGATHHGQGRTTQVWLIHEVDATLQLGHVQMYEYLEFHRQLLWPLTRSGY